MAKEFGNETLEGVSAAAAQQQQQIQVMVDDTSTPVTYAPNSRVVPTAEEVVIDFFGQLRPTSQTTANLKIDQRVIMSVWAAKRLAIMLGQAIQGYERAFGPIELDERKRRVAAPEAPPQA